MRVAASLAILLTALPAAADNIYVTYKTSATNGGAYAPRYVSATWVENSAGTFIKTIDRRAGVRVGSLVAWIAKSGQDADAVTGATVLDHSLPLTVLWDLKDRNGVVVPDGTYTIRMETSDSNAGSPAQNVEGSFTFVKGPTPSTQTNLTSAGFTNGTIIFGKGTCANGVVDAGETCDGTCPLSCASTGNACRVSSLIGDAAMCSSSCTVQYITECTGGDGCCAKGCTDATDTDCKPGEVGTGESPTGEGGGDITGGCASSAAGNGGALFAIALALFVRRRVRPRS